MSTSNDNKDNKSYKSEKRVDMLKKRTKRCVCKYCGGIEFGVEKEIYDSAKYFVENSRFNCYPDLDDSENTKQMTIAKVCEIMSWENQNLGFLNSDGFVVPIHANENFVGECVTLGDEDLAD